MMKMTMAMAAVMRAACLVHVLVGVAAAAVFAFAVGVVLAG